MFFIVEVFVVRAASERNGSMFGEELGMGKYIAMVFVVELCAGMVVSVNSIEFG